MAYISLYRKYRPQNFDDVVGQDHVTTTLKNAIDSGRVANGYLFSGTRGTAKTTCARILAKALNCIGPDGTALSPTSSPCSTCSACQAISASALVDVVEIDAASHGKVEDVRDLTANIKFPPMVGRYKVYIIDEAHQLSRDAMDAFLKTLEEPPDRVVFVLATTEPDKLPVTIASRCQVFEFRRGTMAEIESRIRFVLNAESAEADGGAIRLLARAAEGSYRDSLTLLEQVLAYKRQGITRKDVNLVLGMVDDEMVDRGVSLIADRDMPGLLLFADDLISGGKEVRHFLQGLSRRLRDLLVVKLGATGAALETDIDLSLLQSEAASFSAETLLRQLRQLALAERDIRLSSQHRLLLEMSLLNLVDGNTEDVQPISRKRAHSAPNMVPLRNAGDSDLEAPRSVSIRTPNQLPTAGTSTVVVSEDPDEYSSDHPKPLPLEPGHSSLFSESEPNVRNDEQFQSENGDVLIDRLNALWPQVLNRMGTKSPSGVPFIREARAISLRGQLLTLQFDTPLHFDRMQKNERGRRIVEEIINLTLQVPSQTYQIRCTLREPGQLKEIDTETGFVSATEDTAPLLDKVIAEFGGRLLDLD